MLSESFPSVWEGEHTLLGLPCMKTISGVPPQAPAALFDTGSHIKRHLRQAGYTSLAGQTVPGICMGRSEISSSMGLEA